MLLRITAPHFTAGVILRNRGRSNRCAPIVKYMAGWDKGQIIKYCESKGWECEVLNERLTKHGGTFE